MVGVIDGTQTLVTGRGPRWGPTAFLAVSVAVCRAGAAFMQMALCGYIAYISGRPTDKYMMPVPDFMVMPVGASSFKEVLIVRCEVSHTLEE